MTAAAMLLWQSRDNVRNVDALRLSSWSWTLVFLLTLAVNTLFIWRGARRTRRTDDCLAGMKLALAVRRAGSMFAGGAISAVLTLTTDLPLLPTLMWLVFYGLGLLSTDELSPRVPSRCSAGRSCSRASARSSIS